MVNIAKIDTTTVVPRDGLPTNQVVGYVNSITVRTSAHEGVLVLNMVEDAGVNMSLVLSVRLDESMRAALVQALLTDW